jgi:hypothetical protein
VQPCDLTEYGMADAIFLIIGVSFFAAAALYLIACDRL